MVYMSPSMADPSGISKGDLSVRVEDYLNDKLQTSADLENIDTLLKNVLKQQTLLKQQARNLFSNALDRQLMKH